MRSMGKARWLILATYLCLIAFSNGRVLKAKDNIHHPLYNHTLATILVQYASAVYLSDLTELFTWTCCRCDGLTKHCLQGFVGVAKDPNAIIIAFRGTQESSIQNWIEDLFWKQLDINYPGMPEAMVHRGFYYAYHNTTIRPAILNALNRVKEYYRDAKMIVIGHSMGGAMASFCGLDLTVNLKAQDVQVMTFGQPRVGNAAFASYYSKLVPNTIRVTNDHDVVPHLPPYYSYFPKKTYHHFPTEEEQEDKFFVVLTLVGQKVELEPVGGLTCFSLDIPSLAYVFACLLCTSGLTISKVEGITLDIFALASRVKLDLLLPYHKVWLYNIGLGSLVYRVEKICDASGEDPSCSRSVSGNSISDHLSYYGIEMGSGTPGTCRIVMNPHATDYSYSDTRGNIILSRDPTSPLLELSTRFDNQGKQISGE